MKLLKHSAYNLLGLGLPLLVAIFTMPLLIKELGEARFGLLTLIWAVVSYFGLFDLGLGRALTQQLAMTFVNKDQAQIGPIVATATLLMALLGVFAGLLMALLASWGVGLIQAVPDRQEAVNAVYAMALAMPAIVLTSGFRGILEAKHAFGVVNLIRLPMGLFTFLGPLIVVSYGQPRLDSIAGVLAAGRVFACGVHAWYAWRVLPQDHGHLVMRTSLLKPLCVSGGWLTVSNIISPLMGYVDRFIIGAIVTSSAVAYYATPHELVTKLSIVPGALTAVLFPTFAAQITQRNNQNWLLVCKMMSWLFLAMLPITAALALFAHSLLSIWISPAFAQESSPLLQIFSIGMFFVCLAQIPFTVVQSSGRSDITALIHSIELPFFLVLLWWLTSTYGAIGAACAWLTRVLLDSGIMFAVSMPLLKQSLRRLLGRRVLAGGLIATISFLGILLPLGFSHVIWMLGVIILTAIFFYTYEALGVE